MKFTQKLLSLVTSLALACGMAANMLPVQAAAAQPTPTITLTADKATVCVGEPVTLTVSIDGSNAAFAGLFAELKYDDTSAFTFTKAVQDYTGNDYKVTCPQPNEIKGIYPTLVVESNSSTPVDVDLKEVVSYTFIANKTGKTFAFSLSGDFSVKGPDSTDFSVSTNISVSAKTLTPAVSESAKITGTYGEAPSELAKRITKDMVSFSDNGKVVSVDGTWTYAGKAGSYPTVGTQKAAFLFTPDNQAQYAPSTVEIPVKITPKELTAALSVANSSKQYDGTKNLPEGKLAVKLNGSVSSDKLTAVIQGTPEYDSANVGEAIAIKATYKVSGNNLDCYTLGGKALSADAEYTAEASGSITPYTGVVTVSENFGTRSYNGTKQPLGKDELVLTANGQTLQPDTDYTITYPDGCTGSGEKDTTVHYTLQGVNNYAECTFSGGKGSFEIKQLPMPVATGQLRDVTVDYNKPFKIETDAIHLSDGNGNDITSAGDLQLRYKAEGGKWMNEATEPGTYTVGVYFDSRDKNAYASGMLNGITAQLVINMVAGSGEVKMENYTYGDKAPDPKPTSATNGTDSVSYHYTGDNYDSDKAPVNAGTYTVTATFAATKIYTEATATASFTVSRKELTDKDVKLSTTEFTYNGEVQKPELQTSLAAEDYSVVYSNESSKIVGPYTVTVTGQGNYTGNVELSYKINKAKGSGKVTMENYTYGNKAPAPVPASTTNGTAGVTYTYADRDGTTYDAAPTQVGSYTVTATFAETENATVCTATANFTVHPKGLVADNFTLSIAKNPTEFTYNGSEQKPTVLVADGSKLAKDTDYTVTYPEASTNAGSYTVTVTGKGNYTGIVELSYKINPAVYTLPQGAEIKTELETYPLSIYGGQPLSHIGLKATGLPEGAQFGWKAGDTKLATSAGAPSYEITVDPNDPNYSPVTTSVSVTLTDTVTAADNKEGITGQLSTVAASISKTASENGTLNAGAAKDIAQLTRSDKLTPKEQDDLKSAHLSDAALLDALDKSAENVTVSTQLNKGEKSALTDLAITTGGKAALGESSGTATYTAKDITPEKPADGQLIEVELSLSSGQQAQQPAVPVLVSLSFNAKNADPNGKFQVVHKHTETDASKNFTTQYDCRSVSKSGDTVTVQFLAASFSSFSIQYTAPASGGSSSSSSATPKPDEPQPQPTATPALTASETTWLGGYGALLNAKSGTALSLDVTACEYLPGYIITGVQKSGVTLNLSTPAGKLCLSPAVAKAMNGSYNYTFADALAIAGKVAAAAKPAASPAPVKDPTAASPTPAPTPVPTAAPQPTQAPATPQPEAEPQEKSHSPLPMVAAVLVAAALLAGGYLAYNSASRRKALHDVYAPSKKVKLNQNQNNGQGRK